MSVIDRESGMSRRKDSTVVLVIAKKPKMIYAIAKIARKEYSDDGVKTIYGVFISIGEESMELAATELARYEPDVIICAVKNRERDCDCVTSILQRKMRKPLTVYTKSYTPPGRWTATSKGSENSVNEELLQKLQRV